MRTTMPMRRRTLIRGLGVGAFGACALSACSGGFRRARAAPTAAAAPEPLHEPETELVLGSLGAVHGRSAPFERAISVAVDQAMIDLNASFEGLFGHEVAMRERIVAPETGADLSAEIAGLAEAGVSAVVSSLDEEALATAMPLLAEAGIAVIDVFTSGLSVRAPEVRTGNMLIRLAPQDAAIAQLYADIALRASADDGSTAGTLAYVSEETAQGRSLVQELRRILEPAGGAVALESFHPVGDLGSTDDLVAALLDDPPALLVLNGGGEAGTLLSALHTASRDENGRRTVTIPARLGPAASIDYSGAGLAAGCLESATGYEPGGELSEEHLNMMLNADPELQTIGCAYSQQAYDAVMLAALAAQDALSVDGAAIAGAVQRVLEGSTACTDYGTCRDILRTGAEAGSAGSVAFAGRTGTLRLGPTKDVSATSIRGVAWTTANQKSFTSPTAVGTAL
ncbi:ABC transporter substrate-binding protein [Brachybacterium alimentarium]|uniref:ABC transporter substrate-binding protein n=1 Tax=Brachybacterium alimentarium TaxID=47845 RepID=UPI003FD4ED2B